MVRQYNYWSQEEINYLKDNRSKTSLKDMEYLLKNHTYIGISTKAIKLKLKSERTKNWTFEEIKFLEDNYKTMSYSELQNILNYRTIKSIARKLGNLGFTDERIWTKKEINYLKNNYGKISTLIICKKLKKSLSSIYYKGEKLGLIIKKPTYSPIKEKDYTKQEDKIIKEYYGIIQAREIKQKFPIILKKRTLVGIRKRARRLGLPPSKTFHNSGKLNPNYKHGNARKPYPMGWNDNLKEFIRNRDKKCMICGMSRSVHKKYYKRDLTVHHIDGDKHNLDHINLICLCLYHHSKTIFIQEHLKDYFYSKIIEFS